MFFEIFVTFLCIFLITCVIKSIWIIPARHFAIVEYLGKYSHTIYPGFNFIFWPTYYLKHIKWTWERTSISGYMASSENCQMDIKPIDCITKEQLQIKLDGTLFYNITNPEKAIYQCDDVINLFYQTSIQAIRNTCNTFTYKDLNGKDNIIGSHVKNYINDKLEVKYGIICVDFMVQSVVGDSEVNKKSTELFISSNDRESQLSSVRLEAEKIKILREARGYTVKDEIELERAKNQKFIIVSSLLDLKNHE